MLHRLLLAIVCCLTATANAQQAQGGSVLVYVGTYNSPTSEGIYTMRLGDDGTLAEPQLATPAKGASFLAIHPSKPIVFAVAEAGDVDLKPQGAIAGYAADVATGKLILINRKPSGGQGPAYVGVDATGRQVLAANYGSGSVAMLPADDTGRLDEPSAVQHTGSGPNQKRQDKPHAHSILADPSNRYFLAADLGIDRVVVYENGRTQLNPRPELDLKLAPGAGPRHFVFSKDGRFVYVVNELNSSITVFRWNPPTGESPRVQTVSTLPDGFTQTNYPAHIALHFSGRTLYASNRGADNIAVFSVDPETGKLAPSDHASTAGRYPRHFNIDPSGRFLVAANQNSHNIAVFRIDPATGKLTDTGKRASLGKPVCIQFAHW